jgi:fumarate hydratase class II
MGKTMHSSLESSIQELRRRAKLCRRLANGAVPLKVMQELAAFARDYECEAIRLERGRHVA